MILKRRKEVVAKQVYLKSIEEQCIHSLTKDTVMKTKAVFLI